MAADASCDLGGLALTASFPKYTSIFSMTDDWCLFV